jgi:superkiller protein 3
MKRATRLHCAGLILILATQAGAQQATPPKEDPKPAPPAASATAADLDKQGADLLKAGKFNEAIAVFKQAAAQNPKDAQAYDGLGRAYGLSRQFAESAKAFRTAIDLFPSADHYILYGNALLEMEKYDAARAAFARATDLDPDDLRARAAYGDSYMREKDYRQAREAYQEALGYAPDNPALHVALGNAYSQDNRNAEALEEYDAALRADPKNPNALIGRASALSGLKRHEEAEAAMRALVAQYPKESFSHSGLAQVLDAEKKYDEAIAEYQAAIQLSPEDPYLWGNLGWSQYGAGKYTNAIQSSRKALDLDTKLAYVRFNLGLLYAVQNRWQDAQKEYSQAVEVAAPSDIRAGINDVRDALAKQPNLRALKQALDYLTVAARRSHGLPDDTTDKTTAKKPKNS